MIIADIAKIDREKWHELVSESPTATWFQTPEAYDFYASLPEMMTPFVVAVCTDEKLHGVVVGYVTKEKKAVKQFFTRRAIIIGGPLLAEDISDGELTELMQEVRARLKRQAIYVETRNFCSFTAWKNVFEACGFAYQPHYDMYIDCADREKMTALVHDTKLRQIRKAENEGVRIVEAATSQEVHDFYVLLRRLYRTKVHRPLFGEAFYQRFIQAGRGVLLLAKQNDQVVGGILCPILAGKAIYEWYVVGPAIVTWAAMDYANKHRIPLFDLMGGGKPDEPYGVRTFKQQFGGKLKEFGRYLCVNNKWLYGIGKMGVEVMSKMKG